LPKVMMA